MLLIINQTTIYGRECSDAIDCLRRKELNNIQLEDVQFSTYDKLMINWQVDFLKKFDISVHSIDFFENHKPTKITLGSVYYYINKGDYFFHKYVDKNIEALSYYKTALMQARNLSDTRLECEVLKKILWFHRIHYLYDNITYEPYLESYKAIAYDDFELANFHYFNLILNFKNYKLDKWDNFSYEWLIRYFETQQAPFLKAVTYHIFVSYFEEIKNYEKAIFCIKIAEEEFSKIPYGYKKNRVNQLLLLAARIAAKQGDVDQLNSYLLQVDSTTNNKSNYQFKSLYFYYSSVLDTFYADFKSAYYQYYEYDESQDSLRKSKYNDLLNELETIYKTEEKEEQIRANRNWLIATSLALIFGTGIAILLQKNASKKHQLAKQEVLLRQQKVENLLKEQELASIDAMITGQEKERQQVANELHDDLGGLMASIKLHFDSLKVETDESSKDLYFKTDSLIDEAYKKIRAIAHAKNSGVIAKHGLLKSIIEIAKKVSIANNLVIYVNDHGLDERLQNSIELTIFRIIQELITNIVKHANASEANIHLTKYVDYLSIIIEDNGKGFDTTGITTRNVGMGLQSIDKRISHLSGRMNIDSEIGNGTTIIIEVPT